MADRPEILALLTHISSDPDARFIVIVDDHGRIGRDPRTAVAFREELKDHNARFECASVARAATPEQEFVENVLAARAELDDHLNDKEDT